MKNFTQIIQLKNTAVDLFNLFRSLSKFSCVIVGPRVLLGRNPIIYISVSQKPAVGFAYNVIRTAFYLFCCLPRKMPTETIVHMWLGLFIPVQKKGNLVSQILILTFISLMEVLKKLLKRKTSIFSPLGLIELFFQYLWL